MIRCSRCNHFYEALADCPYCAPLMFSPEGDFSEILQGSVEGVSWMTQQVLAVPEDAFLPQESVDVGVPHDSFEMEQKPGAFLKEGREPVDDLMFLETGRFEWNKGEEDPLDATINQSEHSLTGKQLGNFLFLECIGEGGFGAVYRTEHLQTQEIYASKVLHSVQQANLGIIERFKREAETLARLRHDNIVKFYDFGQLPKHGFYMVMELLEGTSLQDELEKPEIWPIRKVWWLMKQACSALFYIHQKGMIHRDLKPSNFFLHQMEKKEVVKLLDFGIAGLVDGSSSLTRTGAFMGTAEFVSPEQARGSKSIDGRADLYSLGTVLYALLTKTLPFQAEAPVEIILQHLQSEPPPLSKAAPWKSWCGELEDFMRVALAKEPIERPADAMKFWQACSEALVRQIQLELQTAKEATAAFKAPKSPSVVAPPVMFRPKPNLDKEAPSVDLHEQTSPSIQLPDSIRQPRDKTEPSFRFSPLAELPEETTPSFRHLREMATPSEHGPEHNSPAPRVIQEQTTPSFRPMELQLPSKTAEENFPLVAGQMNNPKQTVENHVFPQTSDTRPVGILLAARNTLPPQPPSVPLPQASSFTTPPTSQSSLTRYLMISAILLILAGLGFLGWRLL